MVLSYNILGIRYVRTLSDKLKCFGELIKENIVGLALTNPLKQLMRSFITVDYTKCEDGTYGRNCNNACSGNCFDEEPCNKKTGVCDNGCKDGYINGLCDERE